MPLQAQAHCQEDVGRHLQEFAFPVFGDRFQKVPRAEVRAVADGGVPMRLPVGIIVPVACDALAEETDREEAERRQGEPMVVPEPAQPSPGPVELAGCIPPLLDLPTGRGGCDMWSQRFCCKNCWSSGTTSPRPC
jgi:hypothetical protein